MTQCEIFRELQRRNLCPEMADDGVTLCALPGFTDYGVGIEAIGDWFDCYAYETYSGGLLGMSGHRSLDAAITWGLLLAVSCDASLSAELANFR